MTSLGPPDDVGNYWGIGGRALLRGVHKHHGAPRSFSIRMKWDPAKTKKGPKWRTAQGLRGGFRLSVDLGIMVSAARQMGNARYYGGTGRWMWDDRMTLNNQGECGNHQKEKNKGQHFNLRTSWPQNGIPKLRI